MKKFFTTTLSLFFVLGMMNAQTILSEDFEGGSIPADWTQVTAATDGGFLVGNASEISSAFWTVPDEGSLFAATNDDECNCDKSNDYLITPALDLTGLTEPLLRADVFFGGLTYGATEVADIVASTDGGVTWEVLSVIPGNIDEWQKDYIVDLSAYADQSGVMIAFHYMDSDGWLYGFAVDNVTVYQPVANDAEVSRVTVNRFNEINSTVDLDIEVINRGLEMITSLDVSWTDGVDTYTDNLTGLSIAPNTTYAFTHSSAFTVADAVQYNFDVTAANPNGVDDENDSNDQGSAVTNGVSYIPFKKVVAEEATGTWCTWCPRGAVYMDLMQENYPGTFVGIAVHNSDPMEIVEYDAGLTSFPGFTGFPSVIMHRERVIDPLNLEANMLDIATVISPVAPTIEASLDVATRTLTIDGSAEFVTQLDDVDYRLNIVLTEDHVTGTSSGYDQVNAYAGGNNGPMGGFENLVSPVPAAQMEYNHTARAILGGWAGFAGSVPANLVDGDVAADNWTYDFPDGWAPENMHAVIMVLDNESGAVLNANSKSIDIICPASLDITSTVNDASVPGATDGAITIDAAVGIGPFSYEWTNDNGGSGSDLTNLEGGVYTITVWDNAGCSETVTETVGVVSGLEDIQDLNHFSITPNPTTDLSVLDIRLGKAADLNVQVVNSVGQVLIENNYNQTAGGKYELDLSNYANGVYLVRITVDNATHTERLILSK